MPVEDLLAWRSANFMQTRAARFRAKLRLSETSRASG
jgi:hypothetical protein